MLFLTFAAYAGFILVLALLAACTWCICNAPCPTLAAETQCERLVRIARSNGARWASVDWDIAAHFAGVVERYATLGMLDDANNWWGQALCAASQHSKGLI